MNVVLSCCFVQKKRVYFCLGFHCSRTQRHSLGSSPSGNSSARHIYIPGYCFRFQDTWCWAASICHRKSQMFPSEGFVHTGIPSPGRWPWPPCLWNLPHTVPTSTGPWSAPLRASDLPLIIALQQKKSVRFVYAVIIINEACCWI